MMAEASGLASNFGKARNHCMNKENAVLITKTSNRAITDFFLFAAFSPSVPITVPSVRRLSRIMSMVSISGMQLERVNLVFMYLPSLVRSLSDVAFSDPAKSIRLCHTG